ncbi:MAG: hypothetical protein ACP5J4_19935 [Anaerolineae bacterium]
MPISYIPTGSATIHIVSSVVNATGSGYAEVKRGTLNATRFWLNATHIPEDATVRLIVRAYTDGAGEVRLAVAGGSTVSGSTVYLDSWSMDDPQISTDIRDQLDNYDIDTLYCLEADTDGANTLSIYDAWLLVEW